MYVTKKHFESWVEWLFLSRTIEAAWRPSPGPGYSTHESIFSWRGTRHCVRFDAPDDQHRSDRPWPESEAMRLAYRFLEHACCYEHGPLDGCTDLAVGLLRIREDTLRTVLTCIPSSVYVDKRMITEAP